MSDVYTDCGILTLLSVFEKRAFCGQIANSAIYLRMAQEELDIAQVAHLLLDLSDLSLPH